MRIFQSVKNELRNAWSQGRALFHWRISQVFIPLWFGTGAAMMLAEKFGFAYGFFSLFGIWSALCWFASDSIRRRGAEIEGLRAKAERSNAKIKWIRDYESRRKSFVVFFQIGIPVSILLLMAACLFEVHAFQNEYILSLPYGLLSPANDPTPSNSCAAVPNDALRILLGPMAAFATIFPQNVISLNNDSILQLTRDAHKNIAISTDIYDEDQNIVVEIKDNRFRVSNDAFEVIRPDFSTLRVVVKRNKEKVLDVRYSNPSTVQFLGTFRRRNDPTVEVTPDHIKMNGKPVGLFNVCVGDERSGDFVFTNR